MELLTIFISLEGGREEKAGDFIEGGRKHLICLCLTGVGKAREPKTQLPVPARLSPEHLTNVCGDTKRGHKHRTV